MLQKTLTCSKFSGFFRLALRKTGNNGKIMHKMQKKTKNTKKEEEKTKKSAVEARRKFQKRRGSGGERFGFELVRGLGPPSALPGSDTFVCVIFCFVFFVFFGFELREQNSSAASSPVVTSNCDYAMYNAKKPTKTRPEGPPRMTDLTRPGVMPRAA